MTEVGVAMNRDSSGPRLRISFRDHFMICIILPVPLRYVLLSSGLNGSPMFLVKISPGDDGRCGASSGKPNLSPKLWIITGWVILIHRSFRLCSILHTTYSNISPCSYKVKCCDDALIASTTSRFEPVIRISSNQHK
jgi:hypothetical protein